MVRRFTPFHLPACIAVVVVGLATGLAATDNLRAHARWIALAVAAILAAYFLWFAGAAGLRA